MTNPSSATVGILSLERGVPPGQAPAPVLSGSLYDPQSHGAPVITQIVAGAWVENVVKGDPTMEQPYIDAARKLVERGATVISSACGFSIRHQKAVAAAVDVPVVMSSLLMLPTLLRQSDPDSKVAVLTYDSTCCTTDLLGLDTDADLARVVIGGIEGGKFWHDELKRPAPPLDVPAIEADVSACIERLRAADPSIKTILFECAGFPLIAKAIRKRFGLPVYDITTLCRMALAAQQDG